jgi:hypothetical protein
MLPEGGHVAERPSNSVDLAWDTRARFERLRSRASVEAKATLVEEFAEGVHEGQRTAATGAAAS